MQKKALAFVFGILFLIAFVSADAAAQSPSVDLNFTVRLRDNLSVDIGAKLLVNSANPSRGATMVIVNGINQNAITFRPLAEAIFTSSLGSSISRVILLDYPGHGLSDIPDSRGNIRYGDLTLSGDYVSAFIESLRTLRSVGLTADVVLGHSMGAEIAMLAQQRLINQGTNLRNLLGVRAAIFLVPDIPAPLAWRFVDSGAAAMIAGPFIRQDFNLGMVLDIPPPAYIQLFFSDLAGRVVPNAPTPDQVVASDFTFPDPFPVAAELIGTAGFSRPMVSANIFQKSNGTTVGVVGLEQNPIYAFPNEHKDLYTFITNEQRGKLFFTLQGPNTVHNIHILTPSLFIPAIQKVVKKGLKQPAN